MITAAYHRRLPPPIATAAATPHRTTYSIHPHTRNAANGGAFFCACALNSVLMKY